MRLPYCSISLRMCDLNDGGALFVKPLEHVHDFFALAGMEISGGLIRQNYSGICDDRARDADKLLLTAGKLTGKKVLLAHDLKLIECVADDRLAVLPAYVAIRERQLQIFEDSLIVEQVITLKDETDVAIAQSRALFGVERMHCNVIEIVFARPGLIVHPEDVE